MARKALLLALVAAAHCWAGPAIVRSTPLIEFREGMVAPFDAENCRLALTLLGALTDVHGDPANLALSLTRREGKWAGAGARTERWRSARLTADVPDLKLTDGRLAGSVRITVAGRGVEQAKPAYRLEGQLLPIGQSARLPRAIAQAASEDLAARLFLGSFRGADGTSGTLAGYATRSRKPGLFDAGEFRDGLHLDLDMGTRRVNWNHQRSAVCLFPQPRDLSAYTGLRVRVRTAKPRDDASVTIWLAEADGSWYHVKDAVPLVEREDEAVARFEDFALAEWVAPAGFHLDEDYALDLKSIGGIAIGVINPLGIGKVSFTVAALDLVEEKLPDPGVVTCRVTGKTLSVNGHNMVPPGVFGGYATDLRQEYRPGCQRGLYPSTRPRIPRQMFVRFKPTDEAPGWPKVAERLKTKADLLSAHLVGLLDERLRERLDRIKPSGDRLLDRSLAEALNWLLERPIYEPAAWKGVKLGDELRPRAETSADLNLTELMELNRRLLEAAFPGLPKVPRYGPTEWFYIDCYGERKQKADFLARSDWKEHLDAWGRAFARNAKRSGCLAVLEFWNEPYLNWAERSWVHYTPESYKLEKAADGGPVAVRRSSRFSPYHIRDWGKLLAIFRRGAKEGNKTPAGKLYERLNRKLRPGLGAAPEGTGPDPRLRDALVRALNDLLRRKDLYSGAQWRGDELPEVARRLLPILEEKKPSRSRVETLNRALLSAKFPGLFAPDPALGPDEVIPHFKWKRIPSGWRVVDETAFTYWSGMGNGYIYDSMLGVMAKAVKETFPGVIVVAGWGFRWNEDHWDAWRILYKNTIDRNIRWIDGVHEHHYMGDPTAMQGAYEVLTAYGVTRHGKWLYSFNTETNDLLDSPARGRVDNPEKRQRSKEYRQMVYNMRDCIYSVLQTPDKAFSRTVIHPHKSPDAARVAYGMMKNLRGRLIETTSGDPSLWVVASVDGTDPRAMPPTPGQSLVVFVFNDHVGPRKVSLDIKAPDGTRFPGKGLVERNAVDWNTFAVDVEASEVEVGSGRAHFDLTLGEKLAWKVTLPLEGRLAKGDQVRRRQFFSPDIVRKVKRGRPFTTTVELDPSVLRRAKRAWLRLVVEGVARGEGIVEVGGKPLALPPAYTPDNVTRIVELPLALDDLAERTAVRFTVAPGCHAGYQVDMTSVVVEARD